jgi:hypothetical protein
MGIRSKLASLRDLHRLLTGRFELAPDAVDRVQVPATAPNARQFPVTFMPCNFGNDIVAFTEVNGEALFGQVPVDGPWTGDIGTLRALARQKAAGLLRRRVADHLDLPIEQVDLVITHQSFA